MVHQKGVIFLGFLFVVPCCVVDLLMFLHALVLKDYRDQKRAVECGVRWGAFETRRAFRVHVSKYTALLALDKVKQQICLLAPWAGVMTKCHLHGMRGISVLVTFPTLQSTTTER